MATGPVVTPLRIQKQPASSESETPSPRSSSPLTQPLSDISPMERRRNSPSNKEGSKSPTNEDVPLSSPFPGSVTGSIRTTTPRANRAFWETKSQENNRSGGSAPGRKSSLEKLKRASRVQNNTKIFQKPNDTAPPPRPMSYHGPNGLSSPFITPQISQIARNNSVIHTSKLPLSMPKKPEDSIRPETPKLTSILSTHNVPKIPRPSLISSYRTNIYEGEGGSYTEETGGHEQTNRSPNRRPKSVTFDKEPPDVLHYEMVTPDPSVEGSPAMGYDSDEDEEDEDELEYTPVIEPDHWESMTPEAAAAAFEESFRSTPSPSARPLPPIPGAPTSRRDSSSPSGSRPLPSIPVTKADLENLEKVPLEERVRLMMQEDLDENDPASRRRSTESAREHDVEESGGLGIIMDNLSLNDGGQESEEEEMGDGRHEASRERTSPAQIEEGDISDKEETSPNSNREPEEENGSSQFESTSEYEPPPRLSRESIRRQVEARRENSIDSQQLDEEGYTTESSYTYDQDVSADEIESHIKQEHSDDESVDIYAIPEMYHVPERPASRFNTRSPDPSQATESEASRYDDDNESRYSEFEDDDSSVLATPIIPSREESTPTPTNFDTTIAIEKVEHGAVEKQVLNEGLVSGGVEAGTSPENPRMSLPELGTMFENDDGLGLRSYMTPSPPLPPVDAPTPEPLELTPSNQSIHESPTQRTDSPRDQIEHDLDESVYDEEEDTGSVIRHKIYDSDIEEDDEDYNSMDDGELSDTGTIQAARSPSPVAESIATIRVPSGKLKTRASATPADMAAMAAARRHISGEHRATPPVPRIPDGFDGDSLSDEDEEIAASSDSEISKRKVSDKQRKSIGLPALGDIEFDFKVDDLTEEFDRVIETQKRGYLMRQNTRIIHASSRDPEEDEAEPAPRPGHSRTQSWSVEPWRNSTRRKSQRDSTGAISTSPRKRPSNIPPIPLPDKNGNVLPIVDENEAASTDLQAEDGAERGRLFVKVLGVKDLTLPLPQGQPTYFCLTLDNGLHCVTTSWLELGKNAPIGQEFELVVLNDLEFQLTLQTKLEQPPPAPPKAVVKALPPKPKQSTFSRVFTTPKKRKQLEQQMQQMQQLEQQQMQQQRQETPPPATAWDLLHGLVARDGSFARSYVCLTDFETRAYGRPFTTDINCFNEWAVDTASVKSKKGLQGALQPARKAPYKIGKLEVQLLFVPKPSGASEKDLPKSMNSAIRELREAEATMNKTWEGTLSQQGGDCPYWRRRYFKLVGPRLTAYHEATRQPRATINLSKASRLINDRNTLLDPNVNGPGKSRRKSGFSEDEEGYMFVEEGFRIRFANGEVIDFYADSAEDKEGWVKVLGETIGRIPDKRGWCDMVISKESKEKAEREKAQAAVARVKAQTQIRQAPTMPQQSRPQPPQPPRSNRRPPPAHLYR